MASKRDQQDQGAGDGRPTGPIDRGLPQLDDLYREVVLDHYKHPRGRGKLPHPNVSVEGFNPTCGDHVQVALSLEDGKITEAQVECHGCSISVASGSMMAELMLGKNKEDVDRLSQAFKDMMHGRRPEPGLDLGDLEALEGVRQFPVRIKCALLAWTTVQEALAAFAANEKRPPEGAGSEGGGTAGSETTESGGAGHRSGQAAEKETE